MWLGASFTNFHWEMKWITVQVEVIKSNKEIRRIKSDQRIGLIKSDKRIELIKPNQGMR